MVTKNTVLIIDDELDSCFLWTTFLRRLHYKVYTALTLSEGMSLVDKIHPAIIVLDNNLPDGLGWDEVDNIKDKSPESKINLVSAHRGDRNKWAHKNVKIFEKPVSLMQIKAILA